MPSRDPRHGDIAAFGYVVANPHGVRKGERILSWEEQEWFEGDTFSPYDMPPDMVEWLIEEGVVVAATSAPEVERAD